MSSEKEMRQTWERLRISVFITHIWSNKCTSHHYSIFHGFEQLWVIIWVITKHKNRHGGGIVDGEGERQFWSYKWLTGCTNVDKPTSILIRSRIKCGKYLRTKTWPETRNRVTASLICAFWSHLRVKCGSHSYFIQHVVFCTWGLYVCINK